MLLFGHLGITAGIVKLGDISASKGSGQESPASEASTQPKTAAGSKSHYFQPLLDVITCHLGSIDYRGVLLGSMLPDIIDKPTWLSDFGGIFTSGRGYAHTLLFNMILLVIGLILLKYKKPLLLVISLSSFIHLILDQMWNNPIVLLWPMLGPIGQAETTGWWSDILHALLRNPGVYIPEVLGLTVILILGCRLVVRRGITSFIRTGTIP